MADRIKVTVTAVRRRTLRFAATAPLATCQTCGREVEALTAAQAAEVLKVGGPELGEFIAAGRVHPILTASGSLRVCMDSLFSR